MCCLAVPRDQGQSECAAGGEHPGVELEFVEHVPVVVDRAGGEPFARCDDRGALEEAVSFGAELVGPRERAAARERSEALEVAGAEELEQTPVGGLDGALGPPQLAQLRRRQELVPPHVANDADVARLDAARLASLTLAALDGGAVVAVRVGIARGQHAR